MQGGKLRILGPIVPLQFAAFESAAVMRHGQARLHIRCRHRGELSEELKAPFAHRFFKFFIADIAEIAEDGGSAKFLPLKQHRNPGA